MISLRTAGVKATRGGVDAQGEQTIKSPLAQFGFEELHIGLGRVPREAGLEIRQRRSLRGEAAHVDDRVADQGEIAAQTETAFELEQQARQRPHGFEVARFKAGEETKPDGFAAAALAEEQKTCEYRR